MNRFRLALLIVALAPAVLPAGTPKRPAAVDRFLTPLPDGAVGRLGPLGDPRYAAGPALRSVALAPDGKRLATVHGRHVLLWEVPAYQVVHRIDADKVRILAIAFGPDNTLAVLGHEVVTIWDTRSGAALRSFAVPENWAGADFSPDGRLLATTSAHPPKANRLRVWDVATGKQLFTDEEMLPMVFFSADSRLVLTSRLDRRKGENVAVVTARDARTGKVIRRTELAGQPTIFTNIAPDGKTLVGYTSVPHAVQDQWTSRLELFDLETGAKVRTLATLPPGGLGRARFSPDGRHVVSADQGPRITLWDTAGRHFRSFACPSTFGNDFVFSADGQHLLTGGEHVAGCDLRTGKQLSLTPRDHTSPSALAFAPDGKRLAAAGTFDPPVLVWDVAALAVVGQARLEAKTPTVSETAAQRLAFTPDGKRVLLHRGDGTVSLLDPGAGTEVTVFRAAGTVYGFAADGQTLQWSGRPLQPTGRFIGGARSPIGVGGSEPLEAAVRLLAAALVYPELRPFRPLVHVQSQALPQVSEGTGRPFLDVVGREMTGPGFLSPDGRLLLERRFVLGGSPTSSMGTYWVEDGFRVVDARTGALLSAFPQRPKPFTSRKLAQQAAELLTVRAFAPDGRALVGHAANHPVGKSAVVLLERRGAERARPPIGPIVAFSPDGRWLAGGDRKGDITVFDLALGAVVRTLHADFATRSLAFSPDSTRLVSGHDGATILLWDVSRWPKGTPDARPWTDVEGVALWSDLASPDGPRAYRAMIRLHGRPAEAVMLLAAGLKVPAALAIERLVADLDRDDFALRDQATDRLATLGEAARPFLRRGLAQPRSLEHRRRTQALLDQLGPPFSGPAGLRMLRSVEVLERLATSAAVRLLHRLAVHDDALGEEARRTLGRLNAKLHARFDPDA